MGNQAIDQVSKVMLLLKLNLAHWLRTESQEKCQRLYKSMTGKSNGVGHGGLDIELSSDNNNSVTNWIETHSYVNHLTVHAFVGSFPMS